ncbi:sensor histidine kinase [Nonomuraea aridisoli]|uniref:histidine kinase n=1 Tax=Nonomuraea aridisoli TaxID=2070368 RepID=A0A2W2EUE4_9ACTN|nr:two-component sensor histidine kinase [Nonomuraea aridisoli]
MISPHSARKATRVQEPPPPSGPLAWDGPPPPGRPPVQRTTMERMRALPGKVSIRWRLTITYGALVFVASAVLLFSVYSIVAQAIARNWPDLNWPTPSDEIIWARAREGAVAAAQDAVLRSAVMALIGVGILSLIIGYFVADRAMRPVARMTGTARKLSESTLAHQRIALEGPNDELKELADTFDAMLTRLNVAFDTQRRFVANASHELRTPLTINRTVLEIALSDPQASEDLKALGRTLLEVNARNEKLIEGLLLLARSERELAVRKPLDVREVAQTAVEQVLPFAEENGVTLTIDLVSAPTVGDPVLLERSVSNLLENAVKYNIPENGKVWIRTGMVDGALVVQVANTGQHVPAYEVNSLFEPFRRLHADRVDSAKGSGLGLSIVRAVVQAHGGNVAAVPRDGGGLVVTMRLPSR